MPDSYALKFFRFKGQREYNLKDGAKKNYALIVPTKALINEVRSKIINDLEDNLKRRNYRVVTAASDIVLVENHNFIFVLTPERLLYLLISNPSLEVDYLFIDEAHKLSGKIAEVYCRNP